MTWMKSCINPFMNCSRYFTDVMIASISKTVCKYALSLTYFILFILSNKEYPNQEMEMNKGKKAKLIKKDE